jgi:hypothetical protein
MKKWLLVFLLIPSFLWAESEDSTTVMIANSIYEQLCMDTVGTDRFPRYLGYQYARIGVDQAGWDVGVEAGAVCTSTANQSAMLVDTALIKIVSIVADSGGKPIRALREIPVDSSNAYKFDSRLTANATHYAMWGDSVLLMPASSGTDIFRVRYYKRVSHLSDSTSATDLAEEYRELPVLWGCYKASQRLQNGRAVEFFTAYEALVKKIWLRRFSKSRMD